ncbi:MAG: hypothetical protein S4CHLAM45_01410 [Chlamydiales bacterium]|nr:hypothetical protein [Chlamydiales bacterium]MCH9619461.1 hypothetical protein [Chlamydiales bacterium]MCH9622265.1 hypothetical protein [Chlamydiales bacterium]
MIIRDAKCDKIVFLSENRELLPTEQREDLLYENEYKNAFSKGKEEGERRGYAKAVEELKSLTLLLHTIADKLVEQKEQLLSEMKPEVIDFSLTVAEKIIRTELAQPKVHEKLIHSLLNQALKHFGNHPLKVFLAPDDLVLFQQTFPLETGSIRYLSDPLIQRGDCRIEAASGLLNAQINRQLEDVRAKLSQ